MAITGIGGTNANLIPQLLGMREQLDDLQRQLATGKKSTSYAGMGVDRGFAIGLRAQINNIDSYADTITNVNTRLQIAGTTLTRMSAIGDTVQTAATSGTLNLSSNGQTVGQTTGGRPYLLAAISSPDTIASLSHAQARHRLLADPRATAESEALTLARGGKVVVLIGAGVHSSEIGSTQAMNELAWTLALDRSPAVEHILRHVIVLLVPVKESPPVPTFICPPA